MIVYIQKVQIPSKEKKKKNTIRTDKLKINPQDLVLFSYATKVLSGGGKKSESVLT